MTTTSTPLGVEEAIRKRRSVRQYTDRPVADGVIDELLDLALLAPTGSLADAWSFIVVRDDGLRERLAEIVIGGAEEYFSSVVQAPAGTDPGDHRAWAREFAEEAMGLRTYRDVPVWIVGVVVPRDIRPEADRDLDRTDDLLSLGFAMENLFVAARARGLGTAPTSFHRYAEEATRELLELPHDVEVPLLTPLGYPLEFPAALPDALRVFRHPKESLIRDETWRRPRAEPPDVPTLRSLLGGTT